MSLQRSVLVFLRGAGGLCTALLLFLVLAPVVSAQDRSWEVRDRMSYEQALEFYQDCGLRKLDVNAFKSRRPDPKALRKQASATIEVNYGDGFTTEARAAFQRAVDVWERHVASPVTIKIDASFESLRGNTLGAAGPLFALVDTNNDDDGDTIVGAPLLDAITGQDQFQNNPDIIARFNRDRNDWHFGSDPAPAGTIDFTSVVLHEIGHGLNYIDFSTFSSGSGSGGYGFDFDENGQVDDDERAPGPFMEQLVEEQSDGSMLSLVNETAFPNPSEELGDALTSDQLFFAGPRSNNAADQGSGPVPPKIFAPESYDPGSSIAHLDEQTYPFESTNALMTPAIAQAETNRLPGPIMCGQLIDMGWAVGAGCAFEEASIESIAADPSTSRSNQGTVELSWQLVGAAPVEKFVVEQVFFEETRTEKEITASGPGSYSTSFEELEVGRHTFRVSYVTTDGTKVQSGDPPTITVEAQTPEIAVYPNPFTDVAKVSFVLPESQRVRVEVFDVLGRRVAMPFSGQRPADDSRPVVFNAGSVPNLGSGLYFFRVTGETFSQTEKAIRVE